MAANAQQTLRSWSKQFGKRAKAAPKRIGPAPSRTVPVSSPIAVRQQCEEKRQREVQVHLLEVQAQREEKRAEVVAVLVERQDGSHAQPEAHAVVLKVPVIYQQERWV